MLKTSCFRSPASSDEAPSSFPFSQPQFRSRHFRSHLSQHGGVRHPISALQVGFGARNGAGRPRCWDVALGPLKQIPMNLFIMYMAGNTISIFPAMMVGMMGWRPLQALLSLSSTLKLLESSSARLLQFLVFLLGNGLGLALALYKCQAMGLLPTHASDWLAFITPPRYEDPQNPLNFPPPQKRHCNDGCFPPSLFICSAWR
uniref:ER membrane protein complex subunit 4 n=1 Tax=Meleagris gallopavo TaxID=9103 RepID=A0A803YH31_MELGA